MQHELQQAVIWHWRPRTRTAAFGKRSKLCKGRFLRIADLEAWCSILTLIKRVVKGRLFLSDTSLSRLQRMTGNRSLLQGPPNRPNRTEDEAASRHWCLPLMACDAQNAAHFAI